MCLYSLCVTYKIDKNNYLTIDHKTHDTTTNSLELENK